MTLTQVNIDAKLGRFHDIVWSELSDTLTPRDIRRYVQLAGALEPLSEKEGCTTRFKDACEFQKLEYFITAAINIGDAFEDITKRVYEQGFPLTTYDLTFRAQADSKKNRRGGRTNQGIIEFLHPIILVQTVYPEEKAPIAILQNTTRVLELTTREDTIWLQRMQNVAFQMSGYTHRTFPVSDRYQNVMEYYECRLSRSHKPSDEFHNIEIVCGYPILRYMLDLYEGGRDHSSLSRDMARVYNITKERAPTIPNGIAADLIACLIYLLLSCNRTAKIVQ